MLPNAGAVVTPVGTLASFLNNGLVIAAPGRVQRVVAACAVALLMATSAMAQTTRTITAAWDANTDSVTRGYMLYYGTSSGNYQWSVDAGTQTSTQLTLNVGSLYYFAVRAYDASANLGPASGEATYDLRAAAPTASITATLSGSNAVVTWSTTNAVSATINGTTVPLSGTQTIPVTATTTFTLVATNADGATVTRTATVTVSVPAPTATITATLAGGNAVVTWSTTNAVSARINGTTVALSGTQTVPVTATTTFTLVATNSAGASVTRSATVTVSVPAPTAAITATLSGGNAIVTWSTTNAVSARINGTTVPLSGTQTVPVSGTTTFTLVATNSAGASVTRTATVTVSVPAPTATITAALSGGNAVVTWSTTNAVSATINGASVPLSGTQTVAVTGTTTFTLVATNSAGATVTRSATVTVSTIGVPNAPTNMSSLVSGNLVRLSWRAATTGGAASSYRLYLGTRSGRSNVVDGADVGNVLSVSGGLPRGHYFARVRAANSSGLSPFSNETSFWIGKRVVSPTNLAVSWSGSTATFRWTQPAADAADAEAPSAYVLEAGTNPGDTSVAVPVGNTTTFSVPVPAGTYYVRVRGLSDGAESDATQEIVLTPPGTPGAPSALVATGSSATVTLRWQAPTTGGAPTAYQIEAGSAPGLADLAVVQVGTNRSFSTPVPAGTYYVRVRAINGTGIGAASNEVVVRR